MGLGAFQRNRGAEGSDSPALRPLATRQLCGPGSRDRSTILKWITSHRIENTRAETQVVVMNLRLSLGSTGAPGSEPSLGRPASARLCTPSGSTANRTVHQMVR